MEITIDLSKVPTKTRIALAKTIEDKRALNVLADDEDFYVRKAVANNIATSAKTLEKLAKDSRKNIKKAVAENENTSSKTLDNLAKKGNWEIKVAVAKNCNTSSETLQILAKCLNSYVRSMVAKNPHTSKETMEELSYDRHCSGDVREAVASSTISKEILERLAYDDRSNVREAVAKNPFTPKWLKDKIRNYN